MHKLQFILKDEINGPFDLYTTIHSGQTAMPQWFPIDNGFWETIPLNDEFVKIKIEMIGSIEEPTLLVEVIPIENVELSSSMEERVKKYLIRLFTLDYDLPSFYTEFDNDVLSKTFHSLKGLRLMESLTPYESLIYSILSQNTSVKRWNHVARKIAEFYSKPIIFDDTSTYYPFPNPHSITSTRIENLLKCGAGYRANYILQISSKISYGEIDIIKLKTCNYMESKITLMNCLGIGPKVADCFLLYGLGFQEATPVDIWIQRIASQFYFQNSKINKEDIGTILRIQYQSYAGLAQLYLYHYSRKYSS